MSWLSAGLSLDAPCLRLYVQRTRTAATADIADSLDQHPGKRCRRRAILRRFSLPIPISTMFDVRLLAGLQAGAGLVQPEKGLGNQKIRASFYQNGICSSHSDLRYDR